MAPKRTKRPKSTHRALASSPPAARHPTWPPWLAPAVLAVVFLSLAIWTWLSWTDPIVDFGRELYVPWRLNEGDRLYRDLAYFNGPLSPYLNAALFGVFGVSLRTLVWANLLILAAAVALLWALLREVSSELGATVGCAAFLACCGFAQMVYVGNYNWVTPYSHEATHGVALGLASLWALSRWRNSGSDRWLAASGALVGLAFLTKAEVFLAVLLSSAGAIALQGRRSHDLARSTGVWAGAVLAPPLGALLLLSLGIGPDAAARGVLAPYAALRGDVVRNPFYLKVAGLDDPRVSLAALGTYALGALLLAVPGAALAWLGRTWPRWLSAGLAVLATALLAQLVVPLPVWPDVGRLLPLAVLGVAVAALPFVSPARAHRMDPTLALAVFALALLAKMLLNASMRHYGFALGGPAWALTAAMLSAALPAWVAERGGVAAPVRAAALTLLAAPVLAFLAQTYFFLDTKRTGVALGSDRFRANERGAVVNQALTWLGGHRGPGLRPLTLAALPEGVMLNYLARVANPTPYFTVMPIETALFGEQAMLRAYDAHPPDVVLLVHADTREYGARWFGIDYAAGFKPWVTEHYQVTQIFGDSPLREGSSFGIAVLERKDESTPRVSARPAR